MKTQSLEVEEKEKKWMISSSISRYHHANKEARFWWIGIWREIKLRGTLKAKCSGGENETFINEVEAFQDEKEEREIWQISTPGLSLTKVTAENEEWPGPIESWPKHLWAEAADKHSTLPAGSARNLRANPLVALRSRLSGVVAGHFPIGRGHPEAVPLAADQTRVQSSHLAARVHSLRHREVRRGRLRQIEAIVRPRAGRFSRDAAKKIEDRKKKNRIVLSASASLKGLRRIGRHQHCSLLRANITRSIAQCFEPFLSKL